MNKMTAIVLAGCLAIGLCSCKSEDKKESDMKPDANMASSDAKPAAKTEMKPASSDGGMQLVTVVPGEAGGSVEEIIKASATVDAIDLATRKVTLKLADGSDSSFTAPPEMRNFPQLRVGDKVTATVNSKIAVIVGHGGMDPITAHQAGLAAAPKGAKPGAIVAEQYDILARVTAIDTVNRRATLEFADGSKRVIPVRPDVDLTKYHVGDNVLIHISQQLTVLTEAQ